MKLWDIIKTVGSVAIQTALPGAGTAIVAGVNAFLDDDDKLPESATGDDVARAVSKLPPDQQRTIYEKKYDVKLEEIKQTHNSLQAMLKAESFSKHSTRPRIARGSFQVVAFTIIVTVATWAYGVVSGDAQMVNIVMEGWPFILGVIGPLVVLLHAYFGVLRKEHKNRLDAFNGQANPSGLAGLLTEFIKK